MSELLIPISDDEFYNNVKVKFSNILDGFNLFKHFTITANNMKNKENKFVELIEMIFEENNCVAYVDFYINKLSEEDKTNLLSLVPTEDKKILNCHLTTTFNNGVFFKLINKDLIPFLVRLNTREVFFVTFYFTARPITIWGNYDFKFPCFFDHDENFKFYYDLSKSHGFLIK